MEIVDVTIDGASAVTERGIPRTAKEIKVELEHVTVTISDAGNAAVITVSQHATGDAHGITVPHAALVEEAADGSELARSGITTSSS